MLRHVFRAMGTQVEALLESDERSASTALLEVEAEFERLEAVLSRFRPESDLSRLNREGRCEGSPELARVAELALQAREETSGRFDPAIHDALVAAGYDRTFEAMSEAGASDLVTPCHLQGGNGQLTAEAGEEPLVTQCHKRSRAGDVRVFGNRVELAPGTRLDLGGIGKGYAVDRAVALLAAHGPCLVNAGGDLAVAGLPRGGAWAVAVTTPTGPLTLGLRSGGLATSGCDRRRWTSNGEERHHLIDPASGRPADSPWLRVTVAAASAVAAEVRAKDVFLGAEPVGVDAVLVARDGSVTRTGALA